MVDVEDVEWVKDGPKTQPLSIKIDKASLENESPVMINLIPGSEYIELGS